MKVDVSVVGSLPYRNSAQVVVGSMKYIFEYANGMSWSYLFLLSLIYCTLFGTSAFMTMRV